jgi:UDP-N-acetylmuramoyl-tripeptide--D-alanyl-D-alanine ligase
MKHESGDARLTLRIQNETFTCSLSHPHVALAINIASALAIGLAVGLPLEGLRPMSSVFKNFRGLIGRFQIHEFRGITVIDDSYNAAFESFESGLKSVAQFFKDRPKTLILGSMLELGDQSEGLHRRIGEVFIADLNPEALILIGDHAKFIGEASIQQGLSSERVLFYKDTLALLNDKPRMEAMRACGMVIYVKGANALGLSRVVEQLIQ